MILLFYAYAFVIRKKLYILESCLEFTLCHQSCEFITCQIFELRSVNDLLTGLKKGNFICSKI